RGRRGGGCGARGGTLWGPRRESQPGFADHADKWARNLGLNVHHRHQTVTDGTVAGTMANAPQDRASCSISGVNMHRFSLGALLAGALFGHRRAARQWRSPPPKSAYAAVIVGGGGHGLATAYYLAKEHGLRDVAVLEKGWIGGSNTGRNTTIIRSNYLQQESAALYEHALKLWEGLTRELNYNIMFSQRGVLMLAHNQHDVQSLKRPVYA